MRTSILEACIGAIVLVIAGVFFFYAYHANRSHLGFSYHLKAKFERVDGILEGSDVKVRGIKVGEVTALHLEGNRLMAQLTLGFSNHFKLPNDSVAEIASEGLMGAKYIAITPGENDVFLKNGDEILYTQPSISLESLIARFVFSSKESTS